MGNMGMIFMLALAFPRRNDLAEVLAVQNKSPCNPARPCEMNLHCRLWSASFGCVGSRQFDVTAAALLFLGLTVGAPVKYRSLLHRIDMQPNRVCGRA